MLQNCNFLMFFVFFHNVKLATAFGIDKSFLLNYWKIIKLSGKELTSSLFEYYITFIRFLPNDIF